MREIGVAYNGSPESDRALKLARTVAAEHRTNLSAFEKLTLYSASLDLLVVGSRGYGPLGRLVYGGVAQRLARTARCPLLVLTRSVRTAPDEAGLDDGLAAGWGSGAWPRAVRAPVR